MNLRSSLRSAATSRATVLPIAFILLFGVISIGFHVYNTQHIPTKLESQEIDANQRMLQDVQEFDYAFRDARQTGTAQPIAIGDYIVYDSFLKSPPQPTTYVYTTEPTTINVTNYNRTCEVNSGSDEVPPCNNEPAVWNYNTTTMIFTADYNYLTVPQVYGYEYGVIYGSPFRTPEGNHSVVTYNNQTLVENTTIHLYAIRGNTSRTSHGSVPLTILPSKGNETSFVIKNQTGKRVTVRLPTEISESEWRAQLNDELVSNGGHIETISYKENITYTVNGTSPAAGTQEFFADCDHSSGGEPMVTCRTDNTTNYVILELEQNISYTVDLFSFGIE